MNTPSVALKTLDFHTTIKTEWLYYKSIDQSISLTSNDPTPLTKNNPKENLSVINVNFPGHE
jgi:hypothetical protein